MLEHKYWRAIYYDEREAFVVEDAGWIAGEPVIEYRFNYLEDKNAGPCMGVFGKWWHDGQSLLNREFFTFGDYTVEEDFQVHVRQILHDAKQRSEQENLDYLLAIIDLVKELAFDNEVQDEEIFDFEGIFETGPEDAYSKREHVLDSEERLHDHVERSKDECWRIRVAPVVNSKNRPLGWAVVVVLYPDLESSADDNEIQMATHAELLDIDHWHFESAAGFAANTIRHFMLKGERIRNPEFAYLNDSEIFELISIQSSFEQTLIPEWDVLEGEALKTFVMGERAIKRNRSRWHPRGTEMITEIAKDTHVPVHVADQMYAYLLDSLRLGDKFGEGSPWHYLDKT